MPRTRPAWRRRRNVLLGAWVGAAFAGLVTPQNSNAACMVTTTGSVNCNADTVTTNTTNLNGKQCKIVRPATAFRQWGRHQRRVQSGVTVGGFGLELTKVLRHLFPSS